MVSLWDNADGLNIRGEVGDVDMYHRYPGRCDILIVSLHPSPRSVRSAGVRRR
jgi:hypothetical protein